MGSDLGVDTVDGTAQINWIAVKGNRSCFDIGPIFPDGIWAVRRSDYPEKLPICTVDRGDDHYAPCRDNAQAVAEFIARACSSHYDLLNALKRVMAMLDCGTLVRNMADDVSNGWPLKMLELVTDLNHMRCAIEKAEGR